MPGYRSALGILTRVGPFLAVPNLLQKSTVKHQFSTLATPEVKEESDYQGDDPIKFSKYIHDKQLLFKLQSENLKHLLPIQIACFEQIEKGNDVLASDKTGSGKTLAYSLPILQKFRPLIQSKERREPLFLVLCPTRQLVVQVKRQLVKINTCFRILDIYGGDPISRQIDALSKGVDIVVATPGRLKDLYERKCITYKSLRTLCIDQADNMLEKGFKDDIEDILNNIKSQTQFKIQKIVFSATIPSWVENICQKFLSKDLKIINLINSKNDQIPKQIKHYSFLTQKETNIQKAVKELIQKHSKGGRTIIFTSTKAEANKFGLNNSEDAVILHGDIPQNNRLYALRQFSQGKKKILIATDVASRGLDIPNVELIIHLSPPENTEPFIHRSGRTGRVGKRGTNIILYNKQNAYNLRKIIQETNIQISLLKQSQESNIGRWLQQMDQTVKSVHETQITPINNIYRKYARQILEKQNPQDIVTKILIISTGEFPNHSMNKDESFSVRLTAYEDDTLYKKVQQLQQKFQLLSLKKVSDKVVQFQVKKDSLIDLKNAFENQEKFSFLISDEKNFKKYSDFLSNQDDSENQRSNTFRNKRQSNRLSSFNDRRMSSSGNNHNKTSSWDNKSQQSSYNNRDYQNPSNKPSWNNKSQQSSYNNRDYQNPSNKPSWNNRKQQSSYNNRDYQNPSNKPSWNNRNQSNVWANKDKSNAQNYRNTSGRNQQIQDHGNNYQNNFEDQNYQNTFDSQNQQGLWKNKNNFKSSSNRHENNSQKSLNHNIDKDINSKKLHFYDTKQQKFLNNQKNQGGKENLFVFNINFQMQQSDIQYALKEKGLNDFNFKLIKKTSDNKTKVFGFLEVQSKYLDDLIKNGLKVGDQLIKFRISSH